MLCLLWPLEGSGLGQPQGGGPRLDLGVPAAACSGKARTCSCRSPVQPKGSGAQAMSPRLRASPHLPAAFPQPPQAPCTASPAASRKP